MLLLSVINVCALERSSALVRSSFESFPMKNFRNRDNVIGYYGKFKSRNKSELLLCMNYNYCCDEERRLYFFV